MIAIDLVQKQAECWPKNRAIVDVSSRREYTYEQLNRRASAVAEALRESLGIGKGERVAILAQNRSEFFEVLFGCAKTEIILVPLNWRLAVPELSFILRDSEPEALIYDPAFTEQAAGLREEFPELRTVVLDDERGEADATYEELLGQTSGNVVFMPPRDMDDTWYILYTSGTTGKPKGAIQTFSMGLFNHLNVGVPLNLTSHDVTLNVLPFFHTGGINLLTMPTLIVGGTAMIMRSFDPEFALKLLSREVSVFFGVPAIYQMLYDHPNFGETDLSGVREWSSGGAPMPVAVLDRYAEHGVNIRQGFGMTETGPTVFLMDERNVRKKVGSVGRPQMYALVRVVDGEENDLPPDEVGELLVKGPAITPGYWQQPEKTRETFTDDGWLRTGDLAQRDEDGYYYIVDRAKDMFISGGENVYPAEVENVLYQHPEVAEAAVIGVPDEKWGEVGLAAVVRRPDQNLSAEELIEFCGDRLARYKIPKRIEFVDALPRNAAGKVIKSELREEYA